MHRSSLLVIAIPLVFLSPIWVQSFRHLFVRESVTFTVPGTDVELRHSRIGTHAMMAEYERDIAFVNSPFPARVFSMAEDTCGGYPIKIYVTGEAECRYVILKDDLSQHVLDFREQRCIGIQYYSNSLHGKSPHPALSLPRRHVGSIVGRLGHLRMNLVAKAVEHPAGHLNTALK